jgi:hypothetical protein
VVAPEKVLDIVTAFQIALSSESAPKKYKSCHLDSRRNVTSRKWLRKQRLTGLELFGLGMD